MENNTQLLKGVLEFCVLKFISREPTYGYEIVMHLKQVGFSDLSESTLYPLLLRLEKRGAITASFRASPEGPKRKYYALTDLGQTELAEFFHHYQELTQAVDRLIQMTGGYPHAQEDEAAFGGE